MGANLGFRRRQCPDRSASLGRSASVGGSVSNFCGLPERSASVLKRSSLVPAHRGRSASLGRRTGKEVVQETNGEDGSAPGSLGKPGWERARGKETLQSVAVFPIFAGFQNEALHSAATEETDIDSVFGPKRFGFETPITGPSPPGVKRFARPSSGKRGRSGNKRGRRKRSRLTGKARAGKGQGGTKRFAGRVRPRPSR